MKRLTDPLGMESLKNATPKAKYGTSKAGTKQKFFINLYRFL